MERVTLTVGVRLKEVATSDAVHTNCLVLHADAVGLVFEVQRTVSEGGTVETVVSQMLVPWGNIRHVVLVEERA
jgi:hypothetical protein